MNPTLALVFVVTLAFIAVIFWRWSDSKDKFESNQAHREFLQTFKEGFLQGQKDNSLSNQMFFDDILRRLGYTQVEQIDAMANVQKILDTPTATEEDVLQYPDHETEFDLEEARFANQMEELSREDRAGWAGENSQQD